VEEFFAFPTQQQQQKKTNKQNYYYCSSSIIDENNNGVHLWHTRWKSRIKNILLLFFFFFFFFFSQAISAFIFGALSRRAQQQHF